MMRLTSEKYGRAWSATASACMWYAVAASPLIVSACGEPLPGDEISVSQGALDSSSLTAFERNSIMLTSTAVVNDRVRTQDPCFPVAGSTASKKWTMGYLLLHAASSSQSALAASNFVDEWMYTWSNDQVINGEIIKPNAINNENSVGQKVNMAWFHNSEGTGYYYAMDYAPFRLLAIVPRFDLRKRRRNGEGLGGELRFVFGPVENRDDSACSMFEESSVILEYAVDLPTENDVVAWAKDWMTLSQIDMYRDPVNYLGKLEQLTERVVHAGKGAGYKGLDGQYRPNSSELIRIRTNEKRDGDPVWHLREWVINSTTKFPEPAPVKQSPVVAYKYVSISEPGDAAVGGWANDRISAVLNDTYSVPNTFPNSSKRMLGGQDVIDLVDLGIWKSGFKSATADERKMRHLFAKNTCAGCHFDETGAQTQLHIGTREQQSEANLSGFLTGITAKDPVDGTLRYFHEIADRATDLTNLGSGNTVPMPVGIPSTSLATYFKLVSNGSSKCLDMGSNSTNVLAQQWACNGNVNQRFAAISLTSGNYNVRVKQGNYCLEATGTSVVQKACSSSATNQNAVITIVNDGLPSYLIKFVNANKCMELPDSNNGTKVRLSTCSSASARQKFHFVE